MIWEVITHRAQWVTTALAVAAIFATLAAAADLDGCLRMSIAIGAVLFAFLAVLLMAAASPEVYTRVPCLRRAISLPVETRVEVTDRKVVLVRVTYQKHVELSVAASVIKADNARDAILPIPLRWANWQDPFQILCHGWSAAVVLGRIKDDFQDGMDRPAVFEIDGRGGPVQMSWRGDLYDLANSDIGLVTDEVDLSVRLAAKDGRQKDLLIGIQWDHEGSSPEVHARIKQ